MPLEHALICNTLAITLPCVKTAPFGKPVVPPVYCKNAMSWCSNIGSFRGASAPRLSAVLKLTTRSICQAGTILLKRLTATFTNQRRGIARISPIWVVTTSLTDVLGSTFSRTWAKFSRMTIASAPESLKLVFQFARGVQRIDVDHDQ